MLKPRATFIATFLALLAWAAIQAALKAIFNFEVERFWDQTVTPYIKTHAGTGAAAVADYLGGFWGGVATTIVILFCFEMLFAWRRRVDRKLAKAEPEPLPSPATEGDTFQANMTIDNPPRFDARALVVIYVLVQKPHLEHNKTIHITFGVYNATGHEVIIRGVHGHISLRRGDSDKKGLFQLPSSPSLDIVKVLSGHTGRKDIRLEQDVPSKIADELLRWKDERYDLIFDGLDITVQSESDPSQIVRLR